MLSVIIVLCQYILRFSIQLIKIDRSDKKFTGKNTLFYLKMSPLSGYYRRLRTDGNSRSKLSQQRLHCKFSFFPKNVTLLNNFNIYIISILNEKLYVFCKVSYASLGLSNLTVKYKGDRYIDRWSLLAFYRE